MFVTRFHDPLGGRAGHMSDALGGGWETAACGHGSAPRSGRKRRALVPSLVPPVPSGPLRNLAPDGSGGEPPFGLLEVHAFGRDPGGGSPQEAAGSGSPPDAFAGSAPITTNTNQRPASTVDCVEPHSCASPS